MLGVLLSVRTVPLAARNVAAAAEVFATVRQLADWMGRAGRRRNLYVGKGQRMSEEGATLDFALCSRISSGGWLVCVFAAAVVLQCAYSGYPLGLQNRPI